MTRMSIDVSPEFHKEIKLSAMLCDESIRDFVVEAVKEKISLLRDHHPNALTLKTFSKTDKSENIEIIENIDEFFADIERDD